MRARGQFMLASKQDYETIVSTLSLALRRKPFRTPHVSLDCQRSHERMFWSINSPGRAPSPLAIGVDWQPSLAAVTDKPHPPLLEKLALQLAMHESVAAQIRLQILIL